MTCWPMVRCCVDGTTNASTTTATSTSSCPEAGSDSSGSAEWLPHGFAKHFDCDAFTADVPYWNVGGEKNGAVRPTWIARTAQ